MTKLVVQKSRIQSNYSFIKQIVDDKVIIPVMEGNAHGLGDAEISKILYEDGVRLVAVKRIDEAERLRKEITRDIDILLLTPYSSTEDAEKIVNSGIIATIDSAENALLLSGIARNIGVSVRAHVKFDLGFSDSGFELNEILKASQVIRSCDNIQILGAFSELSKRKRFNNKKLVQEQYEDFNVAIRMLREDGIECNMTHLTDTKSAIKYPEVNLDAVRCGSGILGYLSSKDKKGIKPTCHLETNISEVRWLSAGHAISGSKLRKVRKPIKIAIIPLGYSDGLFLSPQILFDFKRLSFIFKKKRFEINGKKAKIFGKPSYSSITLNVTDIECSPGDKVIFKCSPNYINREIHREYV